MVEELERLYEINNKLHLLTQQKEEKTMTKLFSKTNRVFVCHTMAIWFITLSICFWSELAFSNRFLNKVMLPVPAYERCFFTANVIVFLYLMFRLIRHMAK